MPTSTMALAAAAISAKRSAWCGGPTNWRACESMFTEYMTTGMAPRTGSEREASRVANPDQSTHAFFAATYLAGLGGSS